MFIKNNMCLYIIHNRPTIKLCSVYSLQHYTTLRLIDIPVRRIIIIIAIYNMAYNFQQNNINN